MNEQEIIVLAREVKLIPEWMDLCKKDEDALTRFTNAIITRERARACRIVIGLNGSDNDAFRISEAIKGVER